MVVANAGIAPPTVTTTRAMPAEEWERVIEINLMGVWHTVRAALPQVSERQGQVVLIGSLYSYVNGALASPYAISKVAVESLGRSLRVELAPFGASATVVYYGWVDTDLVRDSLDEQESGQMLRDSFPTPARADHAGAGRRGAGRGGRERAPRFAPRWWRIVSALRGAINPLLDRHMERDTTIREAILESEALAKTSRDASGA